MPTIDQNGNLFGADMNIGTNDAYAVNIKTNNTNKVSIDPNGRVGIGVLTPIPFNASAYLYPSLVPKMEIATGSSFGSYNEAIVIRHKEHDVNAVNRNVGIILKLSTEADYVESAKSCAIMLGSSNNYANYPDMSFYMGNSANPKMQILYNGTVKMSSLAGTGTRMVTADSSGNLGSVASIPVSNGGTGLTSAGTSGQILVSDGTNFVLTTPTSQQFMQNSYPYPYLIPDASVTDNQGINTNGGFGTGPVVYQFSAMGGYTVTELDYMIVFIGDSLVYLPKPQDWVGRILELKLNPSSGNPGATCYLTGGNPSLTYPVYDGLIQINSFIANQGGRIKIQAAYSDVLSGFCWEIMDMNIW